MNPPVKSVKDFQILRLYKVLGKAIPAKRIYSLFLITIGLLLSIELHAQIEGDYRTTVLFFSTENWSDASIWQRYTSGNWVTNPPQGYPGQAASTRNVTVRGFIGALYLNVSPANPLSSLDLSTASNIVGLNVTGNQALTINGALSVGASNAMTFSGTGNLTVNGTTTIDGSFTDNEGTGTSIFAGLVSNDGNWTTTSITNSARAVFRGGITNNGTFNAGGATFNTTAAQPLSGSGLIEFDNTVIVTGVTVTNNGIVTMTNTAAATLQGTGTWTQGTGTLNYAGNTLTVANFNASNAGNTVNYNAGANQTIRIPTSTSYYHLFLSTSGTKSYAAIVDVNGNLLLQGSATLNATTFALDVEGNITILSTSILAGTGNISLAGNWSATSATSLTEGTRTTTFDGTGQTITNASGTEIFYHLTLTTSGIKSSTNIIDINGNLSLTGSAQFSVTNNVFIAGNWDVAGTNGDRFVEGTYTVNFDGAAQTISTIVPAGETFYHLTISGSGNKSTSDILTVEGNLLISGGRLTMNNNNLSVAGNWTVSSGDADPFVPGTNTVFLNGGNPQTLITSQTGGETFSNLTINNTSGTIPQIVFSDRVNVTTTLTMTDGIVQTDASNLLVMLNGSTTTIGSAASFVSGPIQYNMAVNGTRTLNFPIGKNSVYGAATLRVAHNNATSYSYTAEVIASSAMDLNYTLATGTDRVSNLRYWDIKRGLTATPNTTSNNQLVTTGATAPQLTINYVSQDDVNQPSTLTVVKNVGGGTAWFNIGATASGAPTGSITTTAPSTNFTSFSYFALANLNGGTNPLPIELLSFNVALKNSEVELKWSTASETNNNFFTIERATDVENFQPILTQDGKGTSKELNNYKIVDSSPLYGRSYYRLKQTDFDGKFTYSEVRIIDYEGPNFATLTAFPNPVNTPNFTIKIEGLKDATEVPVLILNLQGQKIFEKIIEVTNPGILTEEISRNDFPSPGLYIIKAGKTLYLTKKIVIE